MKNTQIENIETAAANLRLRSANDRHIEVKRLMDDLAKARLAAEVTGFALGLNEDLMGPTRGAPKSAFARQLAMYLTHVGFGMNLGRVAIAFGRDRSTITHACHLIEDRRDDADFDQFVDNLEACLNNVPQFALAA